MITFLGVIIFATVLAIGAADWNSGLRPFQKYTPPWMVTGAPERPRRRRRRAHDS
jgi:hypothetical protein